MKIKNVPFFLAISILSSFCVCMSSCASGDFERNEVTKMIDLHLHLDGAISLESARELAALQHIAIPESDEELLKLMRVSPDCKDLNEFLEKFEFPYSLIQTPEGMSMAVTNLCNELKAQNVIYAEIRFAPQLSCDKGMTQEEAVLSAIKGMNATSLRANLILCCMRGEQTQENIGTNMETIRLTKKYLGQGVCAADLAGAEALYKTEDYANIVEYAETLGVPYEIHAGEADGPSSVRKAIEFDADRIGHGVRSIEDADLVSELAAIGMPLMICPTSNVQTCVVKNVSELPIRDFLEVGIPVTINSDDPSIEGTDLKTEWLKVIDAFNLTKSEISLIMHNAVDAAFCSDTIREQLRKEIDDAYGLLGQ